MMVGLGLLMMALLNGAQAKADPPAPTVPDSVRQELGTLQVQAAGLAHAQQVLQKELDATLAQLQRAVQQAQTACAATPGYELSPALTCVPKKADVKKDEPKQDSPPK